MQDIYNPLDHSIATPEKVLASLRQHFHGTIFPRQDHIHNDNDLRHFHLVGLAHVMAVAETVGQQLDCPAHKVLDTTPGILSSLHAYYSHTPDPAVAQQLVQDQMAYEERCLQLG